EAFAQLVEEVEETPGGRLQPVGGATNGEFQSEATRILDDQPGAPGPAAASDLPAQATAILSTDLAIGAAAAADRGLAVAPEPALAAPAPFVPGSAELKPRSTVLKDVLIGCLVALPLIGAGLGVHAYVKASRGGGTVVVTVSPPSTVEVALDGQRRGTLA